MAKSVLMSVCNRGKHKGQVMIAAYGYGSIEDSHVYVVINNDVIVKAMSFNIMNIRSEHPIMRFIYHSAENPNWKAVATALLIFYEEEDPGFYEILKRLNKTSEEYTCLVNAIKDILQDKSNEYNTDKNQSILMEL